MRDLNANVVLPGGVLQGPDQVPLPNETPLGIVPTLGDLISGKLDAVLSSIDRETFSGDDRELGREHHILRSCCLPSSLRLVQLCTRLLIYGEDGVLQARRFPEAQIGQSLPP